MENVALALADGSKAVLSIVATGVLPYYNRSLEDPRAVGEADAAFAQGSGVLGLIPLELHLKMVRLKRTTHKSGKSCPAAPVARPYYSPQIPTRLDFIE